MQPTSASTFLCEINQCENFANYFTLYMLQEPLLDTYSRVKEEGLAVMVTLSESWLRHHQVLPQEQTHRNY
jgi:hypothetical protein